MSLVSHKKSYLVCAELSNLRILRNIYLFSSSCLCPLLAVSVLYFKKNRNRLREYSEIHQFNTYQIYFLIRNQGHKTIVFHWKKIRKIWMIFEKENWLWKSDFVTFWQDCKASKDVYNWVGWRIFIRRFE